MKAKLNKRVIAYIIDILLLIIIFFLLGLFSNNEYEKKIKEINTLYVNGSIPFDTYFDKLGGLYKNLDRSNILIYICNIIYIIFYFVLVPLKYNGQTLGKKIMDIKVEASYNQKLAFKNLFLRNLIINGLFYLIMVVLFMFIIPDQYYFKIISITGFIQITLVIISAFMVLYRKDRRGIHDLLGKTKVVTIK